MKKRVEGFLKVARERISRIETNADRNNIHNLYQELCSIVAKHGDESLYNELKAGWDSIWLDKQIADFDENFLKYIAGEFKERHEWEHNPYTTTLTMPKGTPNTILTTTALKQSMAEILDKSVSEAMEKEKEKNYLDKIDNLYKAQQATKAAQQKAVGNIIATGVANVEGKERFRI